jgi:tetratricopeptide (TPR) repeat protein
LYFYNKIQSTLGIHAGNSDEEVYLIKQTLGDIKVLRAHVEDATDDSQYQAKALAALAKKYCALAYVYRRTSNLEKAIECYKDAFALPGRKLHALLRIFMVRAKQVLNLSYFK